MEAAVVRVRGEAVYIWAGRRPVVGADGDRWRSLSC